MRSVITRRGLLGAIPFALAAQVKPPLNKQPLKKAKPLISAGEFTRLVDPVTENFVVRLTPPSSSSVLPEVRHHPVSSREKILVFASDRGGHFAPYQADLRTGAVRLVVETAKLQPRSVSLDRQEKAIRYLDGDALFEASLSHGSAKLLSEGVDWYSSAADGSWFLISGGKLIRRSGSNSTMLAEGVTAAWPQPEGNGFLFSRAAGADSCQLFFAIGASQKPIMVAEGNIRQPYWDVDGQSIIFLRDVTASNGTVLAEIHGRHLRGGDEYLVSPTSQFASFAPNSNATVFVGASRSKAQPNIVLMLRTPYREMTLCEHRASHPIDVSPIFSPDNRRVYFQSDHEGHLAIYSVNVELLIEPEQG